MSDFDATLSARDLDAKRTRETLLRVAKSILGNTLYETRSRETARLASGPYDDRQRWPR
jgi:hypothetical protein